MKIFHHNDLDGRCAAAIALRYAAGDAMPTETIELDYKDLVPVGRITIQEKIWIVDFSFKPEVMEKVAERTNRVTLIDHHKTALNYRYPPIIERVFDINYAGCELTWKYFRPNTRMPRAIELIGDRDKWAWKYSQETAEFCEGIKLQHTNPQSNIWDLLFENKVPQDLYGLKKDGAICLQYRDMICADYLKAHGFETEFEGHRSFALGLYMFGSQAFGDKIKEYPLCISFEFSGQNYSIGLYSETIDVSEIAVKYGGGGHKGAAGFVISELPF